MFLSLDPDPGSDGDSLDQNGYAYGNNNPVMNVDPDGHWVWLVVNAGFAAYDGYKAYKSGKGWKGAAWAAASNFGPGKIFKGAKRVYRFAAKGSFGYVNKIKRSGQVGHHMPQNAYNKKIGISRNRGPAVLMSKKDHAKTRTYAGRGKKTMRIDRHLTARKRLARDIWDVKKLTKRKYNKGLRQAARYGQSLYRK
ncbi:hypothetical protein AX282_21865 [Bacillus spizizenii]|nr:hypothetical protein AX282_21865 [Bacillus spizizenii]